MKHLFPTLLFLFSGAPLFAQPSIQWHKTYGGSDYDVAKCVRQTTDGGYILAGKSSSLDGDFPENLGGDDVWILKLDETGSVEWKRSFGGSKNEEPNAIKQTPDGGYIIVGETDSDDEIMYGNHGQVDTWVVKMDSTGSIEWKRVMGGSLWDIAHDVTVTADGGFMLFGKSESSDGDVTENRGGPDFWVVKLSSIGVTQWQKTYGGSDFDVAYTGYIAPDGSIFMAGVSYSNDGDVTVNHGGGDFWIVKLSDTGLLEMQRSLGGSSSEFARTMLPENDGSIIIAGFTGSNNFDVSGNHGSEDAWVVKLNPAFQIEWQKALGGTKDDFLSNIVKASDGGYVLSGETNSTNGHATGNNGGRDAWIVKLNAAGMYVWQKTFGGTSSEYCSDILVTDDGGFLFAGLASSPDGDVSGISGSADFWLVKLTSGSVGVEEISKFDQEYPFEIYPNPARQSLSLKTTADEPILAVNIYDIAGREIGRRAITKEGVIDVSELCGGMYIISASTASGKVFSTRMVKQ